jgi:asparagine synthase (glutamine-hydrolysing)
MCGIVGVLSAGVDPSLARIGREMLDSLRHRGPDDGGLATLSEWREGAAVKHDRPNADPAAVLVLGNRRLAILDLSAAGHQPMSSEDGLRWIVYNGEIYNYVELREELRALGHSFKSATDTEVFLRAYEQWGTDCFRRFNGMWGVAIFDRSRRELVLARDHFGIKPLYYSAKHDRLTFASEIRALRRDPQFTGGANPRAIRDYLAARSVDTTADTFFEGVRALPAGSYMTIDLSRPVAGWEPRIRRFWQLEPGAERSGDIVEHAEQVRWLLEDAIRIRLRSDVPVGVCLSGGLDSSGVVMLASKLLDEGRARTDVLGSRVRTFTAYYPTERYDEKPYVDALVRHGSMDPYFTSPSGEDVRNALEEVVGCQEEPFGSTGMISQWFVFRLARDNGMKVMLDGQGADELFAGYLTFFYPLLLEYWKHGQYARVLSEALAMLWYHKYYYQWIDRVTPARRRVMNGRFRKSANGVPNTSYPWLTLDGLNGDSGPVSMRPELGNGLRNAQADYFLSHSLPSLLRYEDRSSMHFSIESRLPFLDVRLVELAFSLPMSSLLQHGTTKKVLRKALASALPSEIVDRRLKLGFSTPEIDWVRKDLRPVFDDLFRSRAFAERGLYDVPVALDEWQLFLAGRPADANVFWRWANLELWFRQHWPS